MVSGTYQKDWYGHANPAMKIIFPGSNIHVAFTKNPRDREPCPPWILLPQFSVSGAENGENTIQKDCQNRNPVSLW